LDSLAKITSFIERKLKNAGKWIFRIQCRKISW
jgi:hypothetical protein